MYALVSRETWELVSTPTEAVVVGLSLGLHFEVSPRWFGDRYRPDMLLKVILRPMIWITSRLFLQLLG